MGFDLVRSRTKLFQKIISGSSYLNTGQGAFFFPRLPKFVVKIILPPILYKRCCYEEVIKLSKHLLLRNPPFRKLSFVQSSLLSPLNPLTPKDPYSGRTAPLTSKRYILYIYSTNTGIEYFKHGIYSPFSFSSERSLFHNSNVFGSCFIRILYTECAKIKKKNNCGAKRLIDFHSTSIPYYFVCDLG